MDNLCLYIISYTSVHFLQTSKQFTDTYKNLLGVAYDAVWAIALGLDHASEKVRLGNDSGCEDVPGNLVPLEEFDYSNAKMGCLFEKSFRETMFTGITVSTQT